MALLIFFLAMVLAICAAGLLSPIARRLLSEADDTGTPDSSSAPSVCPMESSRPVGSTLAAAFPPPGDRAKDRSNGGDKGGRSDSAEAALVAHLFDGSLKADAYRAAMADLARRDEAVNPLAVPPDPTG